MLEAAFWGFVGGVALLVGAIAGLALPVGQHLVGLVMSFGAGVLISALALELTEEGSSGEDSAPRQVDWQAVRSPSSPRTGCWTTAAVVTASALEASRRAARRAPS